VITARLRGGGLRKAVAAPDSVSVDADWDNGGSGFRAALSGEEENMDLEVML
jgi:hypothetical protein